jgi:ADP-heptose:LPS heptosyltransferase
MVLSWLSRLRFKPEAFSFTRKVKESSSVLICMPANVDRFAMSRDMLSTFVDVFRNKEIFVFLPFLEAEGYLSDSVRYRVISVQKANLNVFSLPTNKFIQRLKQQQFDISLDLDLEEGFFNCYLCLKCKIPLRIGAKRKKAFPLYNVQLAVTKDRLGSREVYEGMAKTLQSLFSENKKTIPHLI